MFTVDVIQQYNNNNLCEDCKQRRLEQTVQSTLLAYILTKQVRDVKMTLYGVLHLQPQKFKVDVDERSSHHIHVNVILMYAHWEGTFSHICNIILFIYSIFFQFEIYGGLFGLLAVIFTIVAVVTVSRDGCCCHGNTEIVTMEEASINHGDL